MAFLEEFFKEFLEESLDKFPKELKNFEGKSRRRKYLEESLKGFPKESLEKFLKRIPSEFWKEFLEECLYKKSGIIPENVLGRLSEEYHVRVPEMFS